MDKSKYYKFLSQDISSLRGVGKKIKNLLKRKKIEKVSDLLWNLPQSFIDRSNLTSLDSLEIGKIATIKVKVVKYNIPNVSDIFVYQFYMYVRNFTVPFKVIKK